MQPIEYRGARLHVAKMTVGWRLFVYLPASLALAPQRLGTAETDQLQALIAEAKALVNRFLDQGGDLKNGSPSPSTTILQPTGS